MSRLSPLVILRSTSGDLVTYALDRRDETVKELEAKFGSARRPPRISLAYGDPREKTAVARWTVGSIVSILTGVPIDSISALGEVRFEDAATEKELPVFGPSFEEIQPKE